MKTTKGLESASYVERLRELRLFSLQKRRVRGIFSMYIKYLKGRCKEDRARLFPVVPSERTRVRGPKLNTGFKVRPHQCRVQGDNHFPSPAGHTISDTNQDAVGCLGHLGTLLAHIQVAVNQHPQVLFHRAAFQPLFPKPVALHGVVVTQVQDLALGLVEPHTIDPSPLIQPVQERYSTPLIIFVALLWTRSIQVHVFLVLGPQSWMQYSRVAVNPFIPQFVLIPGAALTQVQDPALGLVELHEVHKGPLLKPMKVPLDCISSLKHINCSAQLDVIHLGQITFNYFDVDFCTAKQSQQSALQDPMIICQSPANRELSIKEPMPASSKREPSLAKSEPISDGGSASAITYLRRGKKTLHNSNCIRRKE
ncbi:hypothetical protein QYF61_027023 [Mycteria americana]|uniref:Uncharacterized protein n=1 Tax=Mycteria americana TaxID=33587 RepID=A0AAN7S5L7_MYCAM|nr:hypothetical protein QYF61_027023 [Mycteria americana]